MSVPAAAPELARVLCDLLDGQDLDVSITVLMCAVDELICQSPDSARWWEFIMVQAMRRHEQGAYRAGGTMLH